MKNKQFLEAVYLKLQQLVKNKQATVNLEQYIVPHHNDTDTKEYCIQIKWNYLPITQEFKGFSNLIYTDILQLDIDSINHTRNSIIIATYDWQDPQLLDKLEDTINTIP